MRRIVTKAEYNAIIGFNVRSDDNMLNRQWKDGVEAMRGKVIITLVKIAEQLKVDAKYGCGTEMDERDSTYKLNDSFFESDKKFFRNWMIKDYAKTLKRVKEVMNGS